MLAEGITDRFTRFVPREQFSSMNSYDITGVGINISTASELEDKTDFQARQVALKLWEGGKQSYPQSCTAEIISLNAALSNGILLQNKCQQSFCKQC